MTSLPAQCPGFRSPLIIAALVVITVVGGCSYDDAEAPHVTMTAQPSPPPPPPPAPNDDAHRQAAIDACIAFAKKRHLNDLSLEGVVARFFYLSQDEFDNAISSPLRLFRPGTTERPLDCWQVDFGPKNPDPNDPQSMGRHYFLVQNDGKLLDCGIISLRPPQGMRPSP